MKTRERNTWLSILLSVLFCLLFVGCKNESNGTGKRVVSVTSEPTLCAIYCEETDGKSMLIAAMEDLQTGGKLTFESSGGMIVSINGQANAEDFSACWMLFTTDAELSNTAWGTVEYAGKTLGSAIVGAEALPLKAGEYYVWVYQSFAS